MTSTTPIETYIAIVSWNIGNNIDKIHKLVDAFTSKISGTDPLPDIIVFGFQEIPVPVIGTFQTYYEEIQNILISNNSLNENYEVLPTKSQMYTCTGLGSRGVSLLGQFKKKSKSSKNTQTSKPKTRKSSNAKSSNTRKKTITKEKAMEQLINNLSKNIGNFKSHLKPEDAFGIASFVFKKKQKQNIIIQSTDVYCDYIYGKGIKGWCTVNLIIDGTPFSITNTHMPFKSLSATGKFAKKFLKHKNNKNLKNHILFGDLNSRSLLFTVNEKTDIKNIGLCSDNEDKKRITPHCDMKVILQGIEFDHTLSIKDNNDNYTKLKQTDALNKNKNENENKWFPDFEESEINFLPTYKRHPYTGKFKLEKDGNERLPGYADRILYKTHMTVDSGKTYQPLAVTGNDHLPIMGIYKFSTTSTPQTSIELSVQENSSSNKKNSSKKNSNSTSISSSKKIVVS